MIDRAAIRYRGEVYDLPRPARHHDVIRVIACQFRERSVFGEQGFLTSDGEFLNRRDAAAYALRVGQVEILQWPPLLYSEDLW